MDKESIRVPRKILSLRRKDQPPQTRCTAHLNVAAPRPPSNSESNSSSPRCEALRLARRSRRTLCPASRSGMRLSHSSKKSVPAACPRSAMDSMRLSLRFPPLRRALPLHHQKGSGFPQPLLSLSAANFPVQPNESGCRNASRRLWLTQRRVLAWRQQAITHRGPLARDLRDCSVRNCLSYLLWSCLS